MLHVATAVMTVDALPFFSLHITYLFCVERGHEGSVTLAMLSESRSGGEVGPLKATVAPPASTAGQAAEVMRPPSDIKWQQVGCGIFTRSTSYSIVVCLFFC